MIDADSARYVDEEIARIRRRSVELDKRLDENEQDRVEHRKWLAEHARLLAEQPRWFSDPVWRVFAAGMAIGALCFAAGVAFATLVRLH